MIGPLNAGDIEVTTECPCRFKARAEWWSITWVFTFRTSSSRSWMRWSDQGANGFTVPFSIKGAQEADMLCCYYFYAGLSKRVRWPKSKSGSKHLSPLFLYVKECERDSDLLENVKAKVLPVNESIDYLGLGNYFSTDIELKILNVFVSFFFQRP